MLHTRFYDQVLATIEFGQVRDGINQLAGMLDGLLSNATAFADAGAALHCHPLNDVLRQDPLATAKEFYPNLAVTSGQISSTGRRVFEATSELPFIRALRDRQYEAARQLKMAWDADRKVCLFDADAVLPLSHPKAHHLAGTHFASVDDLSVMANDFDLISAVQIADHLDNSQLAALIAKLAVHVSPQGAITVSSILPDHLGSGWRQACHQQYRYCHSEAELAEHAAAAGLKSHIYQDATGCLAWAELRRA